ncbi:MAG: hypothetical protein EB053_06850 [Chlamydiae bacterium]|jgi:hypothetical protein|nr:hypothetical protein [Chlamydiota bacterium]
MSSITTQTARRRILASLVNLRFVPNNKKRDSDFEWTEELTNRLIKLLQDPKYQLNTKQGNFNASLIGEVLGIDRKVITSKIQTLVKHALMGLQSNPPQPDTLDLENNQQSLSSRVRFKKTPASAPKEKDELKLTLDQITARFRNDQVDKELAQNEITAFPSLEEVEMELALLDGRIV